MSGHDRRIRLLLRLAIVFIAIHVATFVLAGGFLAYALLVEPTG